MIKSSKAGRLILFKYCVITLLVVLIIPIITGLIIAGISDDSYSVSEFFKNSFDNIKDNRIFLIVQTAIVLMGVWFIGGFTGKKIHANKESSKWLGFLAFLYLWMLLFLSCSITAGIENAITWGIDGFKAAVINWMVFGFFLFLFIGIIHGLTAGLFAGKEIEELLSIK